MRARVRYHPGQFVHGLDANGSVGLQEADLKGAWVGPKKVKRFY